MIVVAIDNKTGKSIQKAKLYEEDLTISNIPSKS